MSRALHQLPVCVPGLPTSRPHPTRMSKPRRSSELLPSVTTSFSGCKTSAAQSTPAAAATGNAPAATATKHSRRQGSPNGVPWRLISTNHEGGLQCFDRRLFVFCLALLLPSSFLVRPPPAKRWHFGSGQREC